MKKLLGIMVLGLLWCNVAQSYDLAKSYIKQNLERFNELRFSKFGEKCDPAKDKKGDCRVSLLIKVNFKLNGPLLDFVDTTLGK